jgi:hypothetical protein
MCFKTRMCLLSRAAVVLTLPLEYTLATGRGKLYGMDSGYGMDSTQICKVGVASRAQQVTYHAE